MANSPLIRDPGYFLGLTWPPSYGRKGSQASTCNSSASRERWSGHNLVTSGEDDFFWKMRLEVILCGWRWFYAVGGDFMRLEVILYISYLKKNRRIYVYIFSRTHIQCKKRTYWTYFVYVHQFACIHVYVCIHICIPSLSWQRSPTRLNFTGKNNCIYNPGVHTSTFR